MTIDTSAGEGGSTATTWLTPQPDSIQESRLSAPALTDGQGDGTADTEAAETLENPTKRPMPGLAPRPRPGPRPMAGPASRTILPDEHPSAPLPIVREALLERRQRREAAELRDGQDPPRDVAVAITIAVIIALIAGLVAVLTIVHAQNAGEAATGKTLLPAAAPYVSAPADTAPASVVPAGVSAPQTTVAPMGHWTQKRGIEIAERALKWFNWPYSFGAGGPAGPSFGVPVDYDSRNDAHVYGFDCSGLVMYALGPWMSLDHDAAKQYSEVGHFHPLLSQLQVGDMLFWSGDGTINGIGHVAIYIGGGRVVQAPHSGAYIDVVPINEVESGRIGVTRPLT